MTSGQHNILFIQGVTRMGGAIRGLLNFLERMDRQRFSPVVATSAMGRFTAELTRLDVPYCIIPMGMWRKAKSWSRIPFSLRAIRRLLMQNPIHLIHANTIWDNPYAVASAWGLGTPIVCHIRGGCPPDKIRKYCLHRAARLVSISRACMVDFPPELAPRTKVVYNGIDLHRFCPRKNLESIYNDLGIGKDRLVVGMISRLDPLKGQDTIIRAMAILQREFPKATLLLVGENARQDQWYHRHLKNLITELRLEGVVVFTGFRDDIEQITNVQDVAVLPSRDEGFGRALVEAMAAGKPVVATAVGGIPEVVADGVTGFLVPPENPQALAGALKTLLSSKDLRTTMGRAGRERAERLFDVKAHMESIQNIYQELISA